MIRLVLLMSLLAGPALAQDAPPACPFPGQSTTLIVQLFFGQSIKGTGLISHRAWERFVADTITPALPAGFTVTSGYGQYRDPVTGAIGREPTELLVVAAPDSPALHDRITGIVETFRRRFSQRSVGIVTQTGCAAF